MRKNDNQLISDYLEGDEKSLNILVDKYLKDVFNFVYRLTKNFQMSEDVTQESFIKAWKNIRQCKQDGSFRSWLITIARNTAIDHLRKKQEVSLSSFENNKGENTLLANLASDELTPDQLLERAQDINFVTNLLEQFDQKYKDVLMLRCSSNMTFEEIGQTLGKPLHTVKSQYRRAVALLKRAVQTQSL